MAFREQLAQRAKDIESELAAILEEMIAHAATVHPIGSELAQVVSDFTQAPAKRLRPVLTELAYQGFGGNDTGCLRSAFCALELVQSFLLIHDDIMDRSDLRRGRPTVHRAYAARYSDRVRDPEHFGNSMAILAGDVIGYQAMILLADSHCPPKNVVRAVTCYAQVCTDVCYGQALDIILSETSLDQITSEEVLQVAKYKTARYTTEGPLHLGAILAGAREDDLASLSGYAAPVGIAFQIQDDLLGVFGDEAKLGKSVDSDLLEGKRTLLTLHAWQHADADQRALLLRTLGNAEATPEDLAATRDLIDSTGARASAEQRMNALVDRSKEVLVQARLDPDMTSFLLGLADYIANRER
jgi:geranylgeranyl diphosphate synthase type I